MMTLPRHLYDRMIHHTRAADPRECCGLLLGHTLKDHTTITDVVPAHNITPLDPRKHYLLDWDTLYRELRRKAHPAPALVGFYHSHPDGLLAPSATDEQTAWSGYLYLICGVDRKRTPRITGWRADHQYRCLRPVRINLVDPVCRGVAAASTAGKKRHALL